MTPEKIIEAIQTINNEVEPALKLSERGKILKKILANNLKATVLNAVDTFRDKAIQGLSEFDKIYPKNYLIF